MASLVPPLCGNRYWRVNAWYRIMTWQLLAGAFIAGVYETNNHVLVPSIEGQRQWQLGRHASHLSPNTMWWRCTCAVNADSRGPDHARRLF